MEGFLKQVAKDLYDRYGEETASFYTLFPSRRAALFFAEALAETTPRPLWLPENLTVDRLMEEVAGIAQGDHIRLLAELYKVYVEFHPAESFDSFYFWGEMLLSDFDSIDKYLIDADTIFSNLLDLRILDSRFEAFTAAQREIIIRFWKSFESARTLSPQQQDFLSTWRTLAPIYHAYRRRLEELGIAYPGMLYRKAAEQIQSGEKIEQPQRHYAIIGFNALSRCEQILFAYLQKNAKVDFYWDYDKYYQENQSQEAGMFIRDDLVRFPPAGPLPDGNDHFRNPKRIYAVAAASDVLQCKYVHRALTELTAEMGRVPDKETAIVLTDESLLIPLLHSLPETIEAVNVTMGYPLQQHPVYSFLERLLQLQAHKKTRGPKSVFYHSDVRGVLNHPFVTEVSGEVARTLSEEILRRQMVYIPAERLHADDFLKRLFTPHESWDALGSYLVEILSTVAREKRDTPERRQRLEFLALVAEQIGKLTRSVAQCGIELSGTVYTSLLRRMLQTITVPFEGEPLSGVQIMGILETRALDFENVILLSMNDDNFPGNRLDTPSFIPYNLRMAYGLPTPEHHEGVYAYYFARLIQRARRVDLVYSSTTEENSNSEPSRYIYQLDYESPHDVTKREIGAEVTFAAPAPIRVDKAPNVMEKLNRYLDEGDAKLSPTQLFCYVECPLKFYFRCVAHLKPKDEISEEVDDALFGSILHRAVELLYKPLLEDSKPSDALRPLIGSPQVEQAVTTALHEAYQEDESTDESEWSGNLLLIRSTIMEYINTRILPFDAGQTSFSVEALEKWIDADFPFEIAGESHTVHLYGKIDRIDRLHNGILRVVDYKTGSPHTPSREKNSAGFESLESLFSGTPEQRISAVLQTLLYALMLKKRGYDRIQPALYYIRFLGEENYTPLLKETGRGCFVERFDDYASEFEERLRQTLAELFDPKIPFTQCEEGKGCSWCDFREICCR